MTASMAASFHPSRALIQGDPTAQTLTLLGQGKDTVGTQRPWYSEPRTAMGWGFDAHRRVLIPYTHPLQALEAAIYIKYRHNSY